MKFATISKCLVLGSALLLASSAFALTKANLHLNDPTQVSGTTLKPGDYKLEWDGTGPSVEVNIVQGKKTVAKVSAKVVDLNTAAQADAALTTRNSDGSKTLTGARFDGKKFALELGDASEAMQAGSSK